MTAREAAALLGVHYNTVRNRIKDGTIPAEKVVTEHGPTWMIDRDNLTDNAPTSADQQVVSRVGQLPEEALTILAREIVREAGLAQDPARTALLENNKAHAELFRTLAFLNTALLAGIGALATFLPEPQYIVWLVGSVGLSITSISMALLGMLLTGGVLGDELGSRSLRSRREWVVIGTTLSFGVGLTLFNFFMLLNLRELA